MATDSAGNVYVADRYTNRVRKIDAEGVITRFAGSGRRGSGGDGGSAADAQLYQPRALAADASGNLYIADAGNHRVRKINAAGIMSTLAGTGAPGTEGSGGPAAQAQVRTPSSVAADSNGNVYVTEGVRGGRVLKIDNAGILSVISEDRRLSNGHLAVDNQATVYIGRGTWIYEIDAEGGLTLIAGGTDRGIEFGGDGEPAAGAGITVDGLAVDESGVIWFADSSSRRIRKLEPVNPSDDGQPLGN